ncbi:helix-turn-helix transcriptional regulator [Geoglobus acetivorans]|uniref:PadR family transcriptional regulator n=1 Tax=Geoglobus acetivorans TaxID=565033 RepID=A0ABZ3H2U4_GEOAI|nr:PadR family transcriptional regulator [Geoglobus acetivorans]
MSDALKGMLKLLILRELESGEATGYELIERIGKIVSKKPSPGSVYPLLNELHDRGFLEVSVRGNRKIYSLSTKGKRALEELKERERMLILDKIRFLMEAGILSGESVDEAVTFVMERREKRWELLRIKNWFRLQEAILKAYRKNPEKTERAVEDAIRMFEAVGDSEGGKHEEA